MVKRLIQHALVLAVLGLGLPQVIQAQDAINRSFATLELRPNEEDIQVVRIPAGSFIMGANKNDEEKPPHTVYIRSFLMGKTEVTQKQWQDVMGSNPSRFRACGPDCPVESVSWNDVQEFISKLNQKTIRNYRLPSEAEWEYSARAGATTEWNFGNDESKMRNYALYYGNSGRKTQPVGQKLPNAFGLFDMHGNVSEWVEDCWHDNYFEAPTDGSAWTTDCSFNYRALRGGNWGSIPADLRSAKRNRHYSDAVFGSIGGFRLANDLSK